MKKLLAISAALTLAALPLAGCGEAADGVVTLRVSSWEEYIDLGEWAEEDTINLESGDIIGVNSMVDDFTEWFNEGHDYKVKVEYSTFGTNEDLYNRLSLGDKYDLICPSDYMIMKLLAEGKLEKYSDEFLGDNGTYTQNVSPYIADIFKNNGWAEYAACYMWGTAGFVYNPEKLVNESDINSCNILLNSEYFREVTVKDNVRDAYFATLSIINHDALVETLDPAARSELLNNTDADTIARAEDVLKEIKGNVYSFETDSGKADMVTGKVAANYQWSGDAVYIMDQADKDGVELWYSVPEEGTNLWFDGWVKLKEGIAGDARKGEAAEAFVNFLSQGENAVRNMNYIGYTSSIATDVVFEYMEWNYGAEEDCESVLDYDLSYFYDRGDGEDGAYTVVADAANFEKTDGKISRGRQLFTQYPPQEVIDRCVIMLDFGARLSEINQMWINVRCPDLKDVPPAVWGAVGGIAGASALAVCLYIFRDRLHNLLLKPKKGYEKVER